MARVLQEQTARVLASVDQATLRVAEAVAASPGESPDPVRFANETGLAPKMLVQFSQVRADGRVAASNLDPTGERAGHVDLSAREHVRIHLAPQTLAEADRRLPASGLFVGKPVLGKVSKRWTILLSRRIVGRDGRTLGVRARVGEQSIAARTDLGSEGRLATRSTVDVIDRLYAFRAIAGHPLRIFLFTGSDEALEAWRIRRNVMFGLVAALCVLVVALSALRGVSMRRQELSNAAPRASRTQARAANRARTEFLAATSARRCSATRRR